LCERLKVGFGQELALEVRQQVLVVAFFGEG
jgi:hypothetical protein